MSKEADKLKYKTPKKVLENNPKVSRSTVAKYRELEKKLEKLGVDTKTKSRYTLSPPLGGTIPSLLNKTN